MLFRPESMSSAVSSFNQGDISTYSVRRTFSEVQQDGLLTQLCSMADIGATSNELYASYHDTFITDYYKQSKPFSSNYEDIGFNMADFTDTFCAASSQIRDAAQTTKQRKKLQVPRSAIRERQLRRNERERARQNRLNSAFDVLRDALPSYLAPHKNGQKLSQIETLRLAKHYILCLKTTLEEAETEPRSDSN